jgi:hypothetical protein
MKHSEIHTAVSLGLENPHDEVEGNIGEPKAFRNPRRRQLYMGGCVQNYRESSEGRFPQSVGETVGRFSGV